MSSLRMKLLMFKHQILMKKKLLRVQLKDRKSEIKKTKILLDKVYEFLEIINYRVLFNNQDDNMFLKLYRFNHNVNYF